MAHLGAVKVGCRACVCVSLAMGMKEPTPPTRNIKTYLHPLPDITSTRSKIGKFPSQWSGVFHCIVLTDETGEPMVVHPMQVKHNGCRSPFIRPFYPCPIPPQCICVRAIMIVFCVLRGSNFDAVYALPVVPSGPQRSSSTPSTGIGSSSGDDGTCYTKPGVHKKACTHSSRTMGSGTALPAMRGGLYGPDGLSGCF